MVQNRVAFVPSTKRAASGARLLGSTNGSATVDVTVVLKREQPVPPAALQLHALRPHQRPHADPAGPAQSHGASADAVDAIKALATSHGLSVRLVDQARRVIELSGTAAAMEHAFGVALCDFSSDRGTYRGRRGPLLLPAEIVDHVEAVIGLDNRPATRPRIRPRDASIEYFPQQLAKAYQFPPGDGTGQTIAVIELGGNYSPQDLQAYFTKAGLARFPTVKPISLDPSVPVPYGSDTNSDREVMLDIEVIGALAPAATIVVYFAPNTGKGFYDAVSLALNDPATTAISISWGSPEIDWTDQDISIWQSLGQTAVLSHVPIFVASGDNGCSDQERDDSNYDGLRHADFPGTCPDGFISCGGTRLLLDADDAITSETVWNNADGATGGGISTRFPIPTWQQGVVAEGTTPSIMRGVPDVAGLADPQTGISVIVDGGEIVSGGTSAAAPQWAALAAILSQNLQAKTGFFLPLLYANPASGATRDVVSGSNSIGGITGYSAKPGWDACTGLGSPVGTQLLALLRPIGQVAAGPVPVPVPADPDGPSSLPPLPVRAPVVAPRAASPFDPARAVAYGRFVQAAYSMFKVDESKTTPQPTADFPAGWTLSAWVVMQDFIVASTPPKFYGFIARNGTQFVLAVRGTEGGIEWWDDFNAAFKVPFKVPGCGEIGRGWSKIYDTMQVIECPPGATAPAAGFAAAAATAAPEPGGFARQVANVVRSHAAMAAHVAGVPASASLVVTAHSLGSALATLFTMENAKTNQVDNPLLCTFASPYVGDQDFVDAFNALDLTSWRVVNTQDLVPKVPGELLGFRHVDTAIERTSSGKTRLSVACWHAMATYLSLIDPGLPVEPECSLASAHALDVVAPPAPITPPPIAATLPARPGEAVSLNITINVGGER